MTSLALKVEGAPQSIAMSEYRTAKALNFSGLKYLEKSPAHYKAYLENPPAPTAAMEFGTAVHLAILEDGLNSGKIIERPEGIDRRSKLGKLFYEDNADKIILPADDFQALKNIRDAIFNHPTASKLLDPKEGEAEQSYFWTDPETGAKCKLRADFLRHDGLVVDLKTSADASPREFRRSIWNFKYHWQSAFYLAGLSHLAGEPLNQFIHVVVEKQAPYGVGVYVLDDESLQLAKEEIKGLMRLYAECEASGNWPTYDTDIKNISIYQGGE
jgi:hypothetical protein